MSCSHTTLIGAGAESDNDNDNDNDNIRIVGPVVAVSGFIRFSL
jgi:hypothetical protein